MRLDVPIRSPFSLTDDRPWDARRSLGAPAASCPTRSLWWLVVAAAAGLGAGYYASKKKKRRARADS